MERSVQENGSRACESLGKISRWHAVYGISLGSSLSELERLNGRPLIVGGFGTDKPGWVLSWRAAVLSKNSRLLVAGRTTTPITQCPKG